MAALMVSFLVSGIGFVLLSYGRKMQRFPQLGAVLLLLVCPYFFDGIWPILLLAAGVLGLLYAAVWYGL